MARALAPLTPASVDAERSVLGAVLLDPGQLLPGAEVLPPNGSQWSHDQAHRLIYDALLTLSERRDAIDLVSVTDVLHRRGHLDKAGGAVYVAELSECAVTAANAAHHARIVRDKALYRSLINVSTQLSAGAYAQDDLQDLLGQAHQSLLHVANAQATSAFSRLDTLVHGAIHAMDHAGEHGLGGVPTGFHALDAELNGFQPSDLIVVAARPGMGKTSLGLHFAVAAARARQLPVAVFSLEMSKAQLSMRLVCAEARVDAQRVRRGFLSPQERGQFMAGAQRLFELPILIDDAPSASVLDVRARARRLQMDGGLGMVVIDYLQLLQPNRRRDNRTQEVTDISRDLKVLAKELDVPVIALAQLNRAVEHRSPPVPMLSDLRESGAIE
jgi:replicative DNA helicase